MSMIWASSKDHILQLDTNTKTYTGSESINATSLTLGGPKQKIKAIPEEKYLNTHTEIALGSSTFIY